MPNFIKTGLAQRVAIPFLPTDSADEPEIENYLLIPAALQRTIQKGMIEREKRHEIKTAQTFSVYTVLNEITSAMKGDTQGQYIAKRSKYLERSKIDGATINVQTIKLFDEKWEHLETRMEIVPGKEVLRKLREYCQTQFSVNLTENKIIDEITKLEIPPSLKQLIENLEAYRKSE